MKKKKLLLILCLILILLPAVSALLIRHTIKYAKPKTVIYIPKNIDEENDFWATLTAGIKMAADDYNLELSIKAPTDETDVKTQNRLILEAAEDKPDILAVSPISYTESTDILLEIENSGIMVVLIDSKISGEIGSAYISTDNYAAGRLLGNFMAELADDSTKIAVISHVKNSSTAIERESGIREGLGRYGSRVLETVYCDSNFEKAYRLTGDLLRRYPDLTMIAGLNEYAAVGAGRAIRDLGLKDKVTVAGFDNSIASVQLMEEGVFKGLVVQKPFNMGYLAIETAVRKKTGKETAYFTDSGSELVTPGDMYTAEGQKLLFSFLEN